VLISSDLLVQPSWQLTCFLHRVKTISPIQVQNHQPPYSHSCSLSSTTAVHFQWVLLCHQRHYLPGSECNERYWTQPQDQSNNAQIQTSPEGHHPATSEDLPLGKNITVEPQLVLEILYVNSLIETQEFAAYSVDTQNSTAHSPFPKSGANLPWFAPMPQLCWEVWQISQANLQVQFSNIYFPPHYPEYPRVTPANP